MSCTWTSNVWADELQSSLSYYVTLYHCTYTLDRHTIQMCFLHVMQKHLLYYPQSGSIYYPTTAAVLKKKKDGNCISLQIFL